VCIHAICTYELNAGTLIQLLAILSDLIQSSLRTRSCVPHYFVKSLDLKGTSFAGRSSYLAMGSMGYRFMLMGDGRYGDYD
jgi:hypothetical protein